jgi:hypothetical protein
MALCVLSVLGGIGFGLYKAFQTDDTKSADTKSADTKSADAKSADAKSTDTKPDDTKSADTKSADVPDEKKSMVYGKCSQDDLNAICSDGIAKKKLGKKAGKYTYLVLDDQIRKKDKEKDVVSGLTGGKKFARCIKPKYLKDDGWMKKRKYRTRKWIGEQVVGKCN